MEETEFEPIAIKGLDKCAIIYRRDPVSFIYVCYHCGITFTNIDSCLQHIESHFQLVQVTIDENPLKSEFKDSDKSTDSDIDCDNNCDVSEAELDIKTEVMECEEDGNAESLEKPNIFDCKVCDSVFPSKFLFRSHTLKEHLKEQSLECDKCGKKFKRDISFKNHLRQHIERGEVNWNCEGDGIREPSSTVDVSTAQQVNTGQSINIEKVEIKSEKPQPKKKSKTSQVKTKSSKVKPRKGQKSKKSTYECHKCSKTYSTENEEAQALLNDHLNLHTASELLHLNKCKKCEMFFQTVFDLRLHVLEIHLSVKKFKCSKCLVEFKLEEKSLFEKHLKSHSANNSENWTNICNAICANEKDASSYEEITTTSELSCESCGEKFYLKSNLDEHTRCMHSDNQHKLRCPQCDTVFPKLKWYFAHQLEHRRVGATGGVTETNMNVLITNLNSYIDEQCVCNEVENVPNSYKCLICSTERNNLKEIRQHIRERHVYKTLPQPIKPNVKEKISCNICGMVITRHSFRTHFLSHTENKKFPCSFCGKIFSKKYSKTTHERMHTGEKPFQCDQCGKRFFSSSLLGAHKQAHDSKTYPCKICGRVFNISSGYRRHVETHRKDQSFECPICSKSFTTRVYLTRHMHKHNEKKFQCSICENKFNTAKGLQRHNESRHNHEGL